MMSCVDASLLGNVPEWMPDVTLALVTALFSVAGGSHFFPSLACTPSARWRSFLSGAALIACSLIYIAGGGAPAWTADAPRPVVLTHLHNTSALESEASDQLLLASPTVGELLPFAREMVARAWGADEGKKVRCGVKWDLWLEGGVNTHGWGQACVLREGGGKYNNGKKDSMHAQVSSLLGERFPTISVHPMKNTQEVDGVRGSWVRGDIFTGDSKRWLLSVDSSQVDIFSIQPATRDASVPGFEIPSNAFVWINATKVKFSNISRSHIKHIGGANASSNFNVWMKLKSSHDDMHRSRPLLVIRTDFLFKTRDVQQALNFLSFSNVVFSKSGLPWWLSVVSDI
mmetsp:Transcript_17446/g.24103  ORF Transcript_17446/g.24103 Transcript_17446/m.24103 type:complete len:343 (+) Transcript_17446:3-1031(+)